MLGASAQAAPQHAADPLTPAQQTVRCRNAQALLHKSYLTEAQAAFKSLLGRTRCASAGIDAVKKATAAAEQKAEAAKNTLPRDDVAKVEALEEAGFDDEARKELKALVAAHPGADVPAKLREPDQRVGWWRDALGLIGPVARVAAEILIAVLALLFVFFALFLLTKNALARLKPAIRLADVGGITTEQAVPVTEELQGALGRLRANGLGTTQRTSPAEPKFDLPTELGTTFPQASVIAGLLQLLDRLLPRQLKTITATVLELTPGRGMALAVAVTDRAGREQARATIAEADFNFPLEQTDLTEPDRRSRLVNAAAIWLSYCAEIGGGAGTHERLGTTDWASYAWFALGELEQIEGHREEAMRLYVGALDRDDANIGALLNLGAMRLRPDQDEDGHPIDESEHEQRMRLKHARSLLLDAAVRVAEPGAAWTSACDFRVRYLLALCDLYLAQVGANEDPSDAELTKEALDCAKLVLDHCDDPVPASIAPFVRKLHNPTHVVEQRAIQERNPSAVLDLSRFSEGWRSTETLYNLACLYARRSMLVPSQKDALLDESLALLKRVAHRAPSLLPSLRTDPVLRAAFNDDPRFADLVREGHDEPADGEAPQLLDVTLHLGRRT